jgi:hypothetical protein
MSTPFWFSQPKILIQDWQFWPAPALSFTQNLNATSRLIILLTLAGYAGWRNFYVLLTGLVTLASLVLLHHMTQQKKEAFTSPEIYNLLKDNFTQPRPGNPLMNVLLPEINDNPTRFMAAPAFHPMAEADINAATKEFVAHNFNDPNIDERLFRDLGDNFAFDRSMRQWYTTPNTTVPADQKTFAEFCYGDMISCRDETNNELACTRNMPPRWTNY